MEPDQLFRRVVWRTIAEASVEITKISEWFITGVAAFLALLLSNIESIKTVISAGGIKWGLVLVSLSLLSAIVARQCGLATQIGLATMRKLEAQFASEPGVNLLNSVGIPPERLADEISQPFFGPFGSLMRRAARAGLRDPLAGDRQMIMFYCIQAYAMWAFGILAVAGVITMAFCIR